MNYTEMTDFEINKAVAAACLAEWYDNGTCVIKCNDDDRSIFQPCNSWADAGPLILINRIGLEPAIKGSVWVAQNGYFKNAEADKNPLRAAMIVFLMMHEG